MNFFKRPAEKRRPGKLSPEAIAELEAYIEENRERPAEDKAEFDGFINASYCLPGMTFEEADECGAAPQEPHRPPMPQAPQRPPMPLETSSGPQFFAKRIDHAFRPAKAEKASLEAPELEQILRSKRSSFQKELLRLIDRSGLTDPQIYRRAGIDRRLFSKIRSDENYRPSKRTVLALSAALELSLDEALDLLQCAGFTLSKSLDADLIFRFCFERHIYKIDDINDYLYYYGEELLG
ncbi:MAG: helix-turn-helix domain-containing protein [Firmicutes bacterium]|nr:helix-turn-helix domain-containing protein [Bacillota bacterium]